MSSSFTIGHGGCGSFSRGSQGGNPGHLADMSGIARNSLAVHGYCLRVTEDAIYGEKVYYFLRQEQGPYIVLEVRVRSLSLLGSFSKFVHDRACKRVVQVEYKGGFFGLTFLF